MNQTAIVERVRDVILANGVHVYLLENHADVTVDLVGFFEGGLYLEAPEQSGVADLTLSMLDRGTRHRTENEIAIALESNAISLDYTLVREGATVRGRCLAEDLPLLIELMGETLAEPSFPAGQLALAKEQTLVDLRQAAYDTFEQATRRAAALLLGPRHPYAREPQGEPDIVQSLSARDLDDYRRRALTAQRLSLAVVGDIDPDLTAELLAQRFVTLAVESPAAEQGAWPGIPGPGEPIPGEEGGPAALPARDTIREHVPLADKEQIDLVFVRPGVARIARDYDASGLANFILGGSFVSRLNHRLRDAAGLTYGASSSIASGRSPGYWLANVGLHPRDLDRGVDIVREELKHFVEDGVSDEELEIARDHLSGGFPLRLETNRGVASMFLDGIRYGRGRDYIHRYLDCLRALDRDRVNAAARKLIDPDALVIVSCGSKEGPRTV